MTKASDNAFPSVLLTVGGPPSTPSAGQQRMWTNASNLNMITSAGAQRVIGGPSGLVASINFVIDGGGAAITTGVKGDVRVPFACTVDSWTLLADQSGAIVVDVWKDTLANFPPTDADSMCSGKEPTIAASGTNAEDTAITDWTTDDIAAGDVLRFNVDSCTSITRCTLALKVTRV